MGRNSRLSKAHNYKCMECGACCEFFGVTITEEDAKKLKGWVVEDNRDRWRMKGTDGLIGWMEESRNIPGRCVAMGGGIGIAVHCAIYEKRPRVCETFDPGSLACLAARIRHELSVCGVPATLTWEERTRLEQSFLGYDVDQFGPKVTHNYDGEPI